MNIPVRSMDSQADKGFLCRFIEKSVDLPPDGQNGECTVHYDAEDYVMKAKLVNGKREGEAVIIWRNRPYIKLMYRDGLANGVVERFFDDGSGTELSGHLINGMESGIFTEYDVGSDVLWQGYYRNGGSYSEILKSKTMKGYYEERDIRNGELMSIAQYDDALQDKNGRCLEYENGKWTGESVYENGVRKRMIREYHDNSIILYDENGEKSKAMKCGSLSEGMWDTGRSVYDLFSKLMEQNHNTFLVNYDSESRNEYGVMQIGDKRYAMKWSEEENYVMEVDVKSHETRYCEDDKWEGVVCENGCIDLNSNGRRWEGEMRNGKPFGYGILYNEEGRKEYEGFTMNGVKTCYGIEYYDDIDQVKYDGCFYEDKRHGKGVLYDRNGTMEYDGLWNNNEPCSEEADGVTVNNLSKSLFVEANSLERVKSFALPSWFHSVQYIATGQNSLGNVHFFRINGLNRLEKIRTGLKCSSNSRYFSCQSDSPVFGCFQIMNCPRLQSIKLYGSSFESFHSFELKNLPSLRFLNVGQYCFTSSQSFSLTGLIGKVN